MPTTLEFIGKAIVERGGERIGRAKEGVIDLREVGYSRSPSGRSSSWGRGRCSRQ
ncbi:hypothetical protein DAERI_220014 [Deinococcus aerius]|uniref:Uncharacterized protein n=1 Tax=Deinococcus aerius TaxID=200253 RepID=A0A2I9DRN0_9DEIO|nr:hypothetical protein [Deinococcus aerius]GBF08071.1 hypothetical protein DAERI_220014 [Deinococcus aerius]